MIKRILWADDEIDLLKPHIIFLSQKGYDVTSVNSGIEAVELCKNHEFDCVFMDEQMPGMTGLQALSIIKDMKPGLPVIMITKSEEENLMESAIGSRIADYLIKPLNPNQILLSLKKLFDRNRLVGEQTQRDYLQDFNRLGQDISYAASAEDWMTIYRKLVKWDMELGATQNRGMKEVIDNQYTEANSEFCKFYEDHYEDWLHNEKAAPMMSHKVMAEKVLKDIKPSEQTYLLVIDNLRYDQWKELQKMIEEWYTVQEESLFFSILPTATAYARNALFAGMMPLDIAKKYPNLWVHEDEEEGKNNHEEELLKAHLSRLRLDYKMSYHKVIHQSQGKALLDALPNLTANKLNVVVYNFIDMLSHSRSDMAMVRELAPDVAAYRGLTRTWFEHSLLKELMMRLAEKKIPIIITTDHGTALVKKPMKILGDRETNTNLRYKQGKNLNFDEKAVYFTRRPERLMLPSRNVSTAYAFCKNDQFFVYPNNYNQYTNLFRDTFQHGGISMEEVMVPYISLQPR